MFRLLKALIFFVTPFLVLLWLPGVLLQDRFVWSALGFYLPSIPLALLVGCWLVVAPLRGRLWMLMGVVFVGLGLKVLLVDFRWVEKNAVVGEDVGYSLVHWNVAHFMLSGEALGGTLKRLDADVVVLSEADDPDELQALYTSLGGASAMHYLYQRGLAVFSRYPLKKVYRFRFRRGKAFVARVELPDGPLDVCAFDVASNPLYSRGIPLEALRGWLDERDRRVPFVVAGDFNMPRDSLYFQSLRTLLYHPYERLGGGWPYSWPIYFPTMALDHVWVSYDVESLVYRLRPTMKSDHLLQVYGFRVRPRQSGQ